MLIYIYIKILTKSPVGQILTADICAVNQAVSIMVASAASPP